MGKLILEIILLIVILGGIAFVINYLVFFWINKRRKWRMEDEAFHTKKRQEALEELMETQKLLADAKEGYIDNLAYKTRSSKLLEKV